MKKNIQEFSVHFTSIDSSLLPYVETIAPDTKKGEKCLKKAPKMIEEINKLFNLCVDESIAEISNLGTFKPKIHRNLRPQVNFALKKIHKLKDKLQTLREKYFIDIAGKISRVPHLVKECLVNKCPIEVDIEGITELVFNGINKDPRNIKYRFKIKSLEAYAKRLYKAPILPDVPDVQIVAVARELSSTVDPVTLHSKPSYLDDFIFYYISAHKCERDFDELVQRVSVNPRFINMRPFQPFVNKFVSRFGELESNERMVIKAAVSRFFFERFFKTNSRHYIEQPNLDNFIKNCELMSSMSPCKLMIDKKFIRESEYETPFKKIVANNGVLQTALENLIIATFYSYPADILQCVYAAMKCTEDYVRSARIERAHGTTSGFDMGSEEAVQATYDLAFDDFFPIFAGVFSVGPMANAIAIQRLLDMIERMVIPSTYDFAKVVFMTTVTHISNFDHSQYK